MYVIVDVDVDILLRFWLDIQVELPLDSSATPQGPLTLNGSHTHKDAGRGGSSELFDFLDTQLHRSHSKWYSWILPRIKALFADFKKLSLACFSGIQPARCLVRLALFVLLKKQRSNHQRLVLRERKLLDFLTFLLLSIFR